MALHVLSVAPIATVWAIASLIIAVRRPRTGLVSFALVFAATFATQIFVLATHWTHEEPSLITLLGGVSVTVSVVAFVVVVNMPLRDPSRSRSEISPAFAPSGDQLRTPEDNLTLWQWMTVSWVSPLINLGNKRQLNDEDVWLLGYEFQHRHLHDAFRELHGTVVRRLIRANCVDLVLLAAFAIVELAANYSAPVLLQYLLRAMEVINTSKRPAVKFALLILVVRMVAAQSGVFSLWFGRRCYERSRGEMITMLYEKTLNRKIVGSDRKQAEEKVSGIGYSEGSTEISSDDENSTDHSETDELLGGGGKQSKPGDQPTTTFLARVRNAIAFFRRQTAPKEEEKAPASMGKILNLLRGDAYEVSQRFWEFNTLINKPLGLILSLILVWRLLGWPCLIGIAMVIMGQVINVFLARILINWERIRRRATDTKLQQISQYVEAIRHLRWYGWHLTWLDGILDSRQKELNLRIVTSMWTIAIRWVNNLSSGLLPVGAFYAYTVLAGRELRVDVVFPALQLFSMLQSNLRDLPDLITVLLNARVAMGRIEDFMNEPDKVETSVISALSTNQLEAKNASFAWPGLSQNVLHDVTISFPPGLTMIFGPVGVGKSALLNALLGELDLRGGELMRPTSAIGYCAQTPWLQSMSIRENILFTCPYEESRYRQTLEACALTTDLASFKHGDLSNIGENGIGLSGGQKARVALARAVYNRSKILMLDDPLSALDQQTAEWIVKKCLTGPLVKDRTVILVTHRTDLCKDVANQLVEITSGTARILDGKAAALEDLTLITTTSHASAAAEQTEAMESAAIPENFVEDEHRADGGVQFFVYWEYFKAGKLKWWFLTIAFAAMTQTLTLTQIWFLKEWSEAYNKVQELLFMALTYHADIHLMETPIGRFFDRFPDPTSNVQPWLIAFLLIVVLESVALAISRTLLVVVTYSAGRQMFKDVMNRISTATFRFYDITPIGRLMNRLTSDVGTVDGNVSNQFITVAWFGITWASSLVIIAFVTPLFLAFSLALTVAYVLIFLRFLPTSQSLRRLEMVSLSPLMSNFGALLNGLTTVRAFCAQPQFQSRVIAVTDNFQKMDHFYWSLQAWLMYRFDTLSGLSTFLLTLLAISSHLTPGLTAFVLVAASRFVDSTHVLCRAYGQLQLDFVSVERVVELLHLPCELPGTIIPPAAWPSPGASICITNLSIAYTPTSPPALQNINLTIPGARTTAIVGRTGSGKSTLALSLLATITPTAGRIEIDGIDLALVSKQILRERITFLAQDPVLFPGSIRHNLDPLSQHSDTECAGVLSRVCRNQNLSLTTTVEAGGRNLSQGQRQLVGLARAILRKSAIVIMDEATASVDLETGWEVQRLLREEMVGSTVITIAHRAGAVRGAEGVVRLEGGRVVEVLGEVRAEMEDLE